MDDHQCAVLAIYFCVRVQFTPANALVPPRAARCSLCYYGIVAAYWLQSLSLSVSLSVCVYVLACVVPAVQDRVPALCWSLFLLVRRRKRQRHGLHGGLCRLALTVGILLDGSRLVFVQGWTGQLFETCVLPVQKARRVPE